MSSRRSTDGQRASTRSERLPGERLLRAAEQGDETELRRLLQADKGAVEFADASGDTALRLAARRGHASCVQILLAAGADVDDTSAFVRPGWTPLHEAASAGWADCVQALLEAGAITEAENHDGWTPLHLAAHRGRPACVQALLTFGARPDARDPVSRQGAQ